MNENRKHCKRIADTLEAIANNELFKCPECGEWIHDYKETETGFECGCGCHTEEEPVFVNMWDYFEECYDIEYRVGADKEYRNARVMVACGGPNIYVDTKSKCVELFWWTEFESYPLDYDTVEVIDQTMEDFFSC